MTPMGTDGNDKDKPSDQISELLKKHYKLNKKQDVEQFVENVMSKIDSLFHKDVFSQKCINDDGRTLTDEERYWLGLEEYANNNVTALQHKTITDHILSCKACRKNYNDFIDKKKELSKLLVLST